MTELVKNIEKNPLNQSIFSINKYGKAHAISHHGELLQGMFFGSDGELYRGLVTVPCPLFDTKATFFITKNTNVRIVPEYKAKALNAVKFTLSYLGVDKMYGGCLRIESNVPPRLGFGSSTSDVVAAIKAVVNAFGAKLSPEDIAKIAVCAETASDSIMYTDRTVLFAHRLGDIIEDFDKKMPDFDVVGFNTDITGQGIDTLSFSPANYSSQDIEQFRPLHSLLRHAIRKQDVRLMGKVAHASAVINQKFIQKPKFEQVERICERTGAIGMQVSHSGSLMGIMFDTKEDALAKKERISYCKKQLQEIGFNIVWHFQTI